MKQSQAVILKKHIYEISLQKTALMTAQKGKAIELRQSVLK